MPTLWMLLLVAAGLMVVPEGRAQVVVYRLDFQQIGESINYRPYLFGYYVAPMAGGSGSLILTQAAGTQKQYYTYDNFGELFVAVKGDTKKVVFSASATNEVSTTVFYALGTADKEYEVEDRNLQGRVKVAKRLSGYALSADSEQDLPFYGTGASVGVAGASELVARLDEANTNRAVQEKLDVNDTVDVVINLLTRAGFVNGRQQNQGGGGGNGGNGGGGQGGGGNNGGGGFNGN